MSGVGKLKRDDSDHNELAQQDAAKRRLVRCKYHKIMNDIRENRDDIASVDSDKFHVIINKLDELHKNVHKPRDQVVDAETLLDLANTVYSSAKSYSNEGVTPSDFISGLLRNFTKTQGRSATSETPDNSILWKEIGFAVSPIFTNFRGLCTMIGAMQTELKKRKIAVYRKRVKPTERSQPEELDNIGEARTDTDKNMSTMFEILKTKESVKLESLILNRKSFAQTVENLFALSFLVKDARIQMAVDGKGSHIVSLRNAPRADDVMSGKYSYSHFVFRYDFKDWKLMLDILPLVEELMPHRNDSEAPLQKL